MIGFPPPRIRWAAAWVFIAVIPAVDACTASSPPEQSHSVQEPIKAGWTVITGPLGVQVLIPPHEDATGITIDLAQPDPNRGFVAAGPAFDIGPSGRTFTTPIEIRLPFSGTANGREKEILTIFTSEAGDWHGIDTKMDRVRHQLVARVKHLTAYQPGVPPGTPPAVNASGFWHGNLVFAGTNRPFSFQLQQRQDGRVLGYVPGGTSFRTIENAKVAGTNLEMTLRLRDSRVVRTYALFLGIDPAAGTLDGYSINTIVEGVTPAPAPESNSVHLDTLAAPFVPPVHERRYRWTTDAHDFDVEMAIVQDAGGQFVSGGYVDRSDACAPWACGGGVTSFTEVSGAIHAEFALGGTCAPGAPGHLDATFDGTKYSGSWVFSYGLTPGCPQTSGTVWGGKAGHSRGDHVASMLASLAKIADDLETAVPPGDPPFTFPSYKPVSSSYLHFGVNKSGLLDIFRSEVQSYGARTVTFDTIRSAMSVVDPDTYPPLQQGANALGLDFHDVRQSQSVTYRDSDTTQQAHSELKYFLNAGAAGWLLIGNQDANPIPPWIMECPSPLFTVVPVPMNQLTAFPPIGAVANPGHVFPSDHTGFFVSSPGQPVFAPSAGGIVGLSSTTKTGSQTGTFYEVDIRACSQVDIRLSLLTSISPSLSSILSNSPKTCTTYFPAPGDTVTQCAVNLDPPTPIAAGEVIGGVDVQIDFGMTDTRVGPLAFANPSHYSKQALHTVAPLDYFTQSVYETLLPFVVDYTNTSVKRTIPPLGGVFMQDVVGTAQGNWFSPAAPAGPNDPESPHLALIHHYVRYDKGLISTGTSLQNISPPGSDEFIFNPVQSGRVNLDFNLVSSDGNVYCYDSFEGASMSGKVVMLTMPNSTTLQVEVESFPDCGAAPGGSGTWMMSGAATTYLR
jgi:hypothetical protein